jgi:hypothetical protein
LVEDNAGWHRSEKVEEIEGITLEFFPPFQIDLWLASAILMV